MVSARVLELTSCLIIIAFDTSQTAAIKRQEFATVGMEINIRCSIGHSAYRGYFWKINGLLYEILHPPRESNIIVCGFTRCDFNHLSISAVRPELDRYTFQCVSINYHTGMVELGDIFELNVSQQFYTDGYNLSAAEDILDLDYTKYDVGPVDTTIGWTHSDLTCMPAYFAVEGYYNLTSLDSQQPTLTLNSTSNTVHVPTDVTAMSLYWQLSAYEETGIKCSPNSDRRYYQFCSNTSSAIPIQPTSDGVACVPIPMVAALGQNNSSSLTVLWPETPHTPGKLCYCPPFEGEHHLFSCCINTSSCATYYSVSVRNDSVCFAGLHHELTSIPVYFTLLEPCDQCVIRSLLAVYTIVVIPGSTVEATEEATDSEASNATTRYQSMSTPEMYTNVGPSATFSLEIAVSCSVLLGFLFGFLLAAALFSIFMLCRKKRRDTRVLIIRKSIGANWNRDASQTERNALYSSIDSLSPPYSLPVDHMPSAHECPSLDETTPTPNHCSAGEAAIYSVLDCNMHTTTGEAVDTLEKGIYSVVKKGKDDDTSESVCGNVDQTIISDPIGNERGSCHATTEPDLALASLYDKETREARCDTW